MTTQEYDAKSQPVLGTGSNAVGTRSWLKRNKARIAATLTAIACAAACAVPLLIAGGVTAGLGALFTDSDLLGPALLAATAAGGFVWWQRKRAGASKAAAAAGSGDGC
ncbi:MAG: hypothetical protein ABI912_07355 [Actinomycetota bacterium]